MKALLERSTGLTAPEANGTLRVTYGRVSGVDSRDGLFFKPQTTLSGILEKQTGQGEFDAPKRLLDAVAALRAGKTTPYLDETLHDVPVDFLSTVDTTGGNSGSATLNARGELCGLLFDGTYDTVASDIVYDPVHTRSIHVDSRYLLWVLAEVDGANRILEEIGQSHDPGGRVGPGGVSMNDKERKASWDDILAKLKRERDELALKMHLGKKEALAEWEKLEAKWNRLKAEKGPPMKEAAAQTAEGVSAALDLAAEELKKGYEKIRKIL
jgi:hypothetical protein